MQPRARHTRLRAALAAERPAMVELLQELVRTPSVGGTRAESELQGATRPRLRGIWTRNRPVAIAAGRAGTCARLPRRRSRPPGRVPRAYPCGSADWAVAPHDL